MRIKLSKLALSASIVLALAFTISCSDDKDDKDDKPKKEKWCVYGVTAPYLTCIKIGVEHANPVAASMVTKDGCSEAVVKYGAEVVEGPQNSEDCSGGYYDGTETQ